MHTSQHLRRGLRPLDEDHGARGAVVVDVAADQALELLHAGRLHVLADGHEHVLNAVLDCLGRVADERLGQQFLGGRGALEGDLLGQVVGQGDEQVALGRRGRLAAHLDDAADLRGLVHIGPDAALGGLARGEVARLAARLGADDENRLFHVAARLGEGGLALHHGQVGAVAQRLDCRG